MNQRRHGRSLRNALRKEFRKVMRNIFQQIIKTNNKSNGSTGSIGSYNNLCVLSFWGHLGLYRLLLSDSGLLHQVRQPALCLGIGFETEIFGGRLVLTDESSTRFRHWKWRQLIYDEVDQSRRRDVSARIVDAALDQRKFVDVLILDRDTNFSAR